MAIAFYNQTSFCTTKQSVSPVLLYHVNETNERNVIPEMTSSYSNSMVQSKVKVHKILPQLRSVWQIVSCFYLILSFS